MISSRLLFGEQDNVKGQTVKPANHGSPINNKKEVDEKWPISLCLSWINW